MTGSSSRHFWMPRPPARDQFFVGLTAAAAMMVAAALSMQGSRIADRPVHFAGMAGSSETASVPALAPSGPDPRDAALRELVIGRWKNYFHGDRVIENRPDGTATMDVTFDLVASFLYGATMRIELTWGIERGILAYEMTSGLPEKTFHSLVASEGDHASYEFEQISANFMRLIRTTDPEEKYTWSRID